MILYPSQVEVLNNAKKNFVLALGTGSGKTYIGLHHYLKWSDEKLLIVAPPSKVKEGGWQKSIAFLMDRYNTTIDYEIISWAILSRRWQEFKGYYVIVDECHTVKNSTSKVGKAMHQLSQFADGYCLLSATPMSNGWEDSINYFKMFGFTKNKTHFMRKYALIENKQTHDGRNFPVITGWRNETELKSFWQSISIEREAAHFVELPELNEQFIDFTKSKFYKEIDKERVIENENGRVELLDNLPKLNAARRKFGNLKEKIDHLKMVIDTHENVLIFYNFNVERDELLKLCKQMKKTVFEVSGHKFELPDNEVTNTVTIVQYQAGGAGIELQYCSIAVMFSPTYSYQDYIQSIGRAYRPGGHSRLTMFKYKVKGTIDTQIYQALENKQDFKDSLYREE